VLARLAQFSEDRLEVTAQGYAGTTPYARFLDWPVVGLSLLVLAFFILVARRASSR
jgi:apolipoprotein N-acyltransferase